MAKVPFADYEDFDACVIDQRRQGHSEDAARRICGKLQAETEGKQDAMREVERLDFGRFSKVERTPQGGMRVPANLTRIGVFTYTRADGSKVRELRHPDEVFAEDSLATLAGAPVTDLHPTKPVRPSNWRKVSVGHVGDEIKAEGRFVSARLMIQDADAIAAIERDERHELSCGYTCRLDETAGEYNGERYDVVQRVIRYNHVAIGPKGWGRAGNEVALRLDSNGNQVTTGDPSTPRGQTMKYEIDGVQYDTASPEFLQALSLRDKRHDEQIATLTSERDTATAERDAAIKDRDDAKTALDEANDPKRLDGLVAARVALVTSARRVLGADFKADGKSDREIMIETIRKDADDFDAEGKSDDYVRAYFEAQTKSAKRHDEGGTGIGAARSAAVDATKTDGRRDSADGDGEDRQDAEAARQRMIEHNRDAAKQPLRFSRND